jgi:CelD/BcsL family acetyltransferase involved in cellulose biosynthesis
LPFKKLRFQSRGASFSPHPAATAFAGPKARTAIVATTPFAIITIGSPLHLHRIADDCKAFKGRLSRSHRRATQKAERRLEKLGDLRLVMRSRLAPEEIDPWLAKAFEVEDSSWKGDSGSSVLWSPGMSEFFLRQARQLARLGQLEIALLELEGRPIASLFGFSAKGVYHAHKIGYDPQYGQFSLGQVMFWRILDQLHAQGGWKLIDCVGPITEATSRWRPDTCTIGRLVLAPRKLVGRIALGTYRHVWPTIRWLRGRVSVTAKVREPAEPAGSEAVPAGMHTPARSRSDKASV